MSARITVCNQAFTPNGGRCGLPKGHKGAHSLKMPGKMYQRLSYVNSLRRKKRKK